MTRRGPLSLHAPGLSPGEARTLGQGPPPSLRPLGTSPACSAGSGPACPSSRTPVSQGHVLRAPSFPYCFGVLPVAPTTLSQTAESRWRFFLPHCPSARPDASESLTARVLRFIVWSPPAHGTHETLTRAQPETPTNRKPSHSARQGPTSGARGPPGPPPPPLPPLPAEGTSGREDGPLPGSGSFWSPPELGRL